MKRQGATARRNMPSELLTPKGIAQEWDKRTGCVTYKVRAEWIVWLWFL